jgi:hypothetical protein
MKTDTVTNLKFIRITDHVRPGQWVEWEVEFKRGEHSYSGFLYAQPNSPESMFDNEIHDAMMHEAIADIDVDFDSSVEKFHWAETLGQRGLKVSFNIDRKTASVRGSKNVLAAFLIEHYDSEEDARHLHSEIFTEAIV